MIYEEPRNTHRSRPPARSKVLCSLKILSLPSSSSSREDIRSIISISRVCGNRISGVTSFNYGISDLSARPDINESV